MRVKLGDICEIVSGSTPKTNIEEYWDGDIKWITPAELNDETYIITDSVRKITELGVKKTGLTPFPKGTVILSSRAPIGKVAIAGCEMYCNQGFKNLICSEKIDNRYLYWFLKGNTEFLQSLGRGATFKEISKTIVANIEINIPDKSVQTQIVDNLEKTSQIIRLRKQELSKLEELVRARFVEMFGDIRYEEKYQGIPLRRLCTTISGGTPSTKCSEYYEGNIPWISTVSLGPNYIDGSTAKGYITQEAIDNSATKLIPAGNILFGTRVGVGKSSINDVALCINQDIVAIVGIDKNRFNVLFIKYVLDTYQSYYDSIKKGATILGITGDDLKNTLIPVPPLELQNQFADFVKVVDKSKAAVQKALDQAQLLFDSLMQEYFG
ncbi:MAG: restriction endonuclease subunit S [Clostridium sp.]|nr:restriction endonuclease subunit S [Clostridium sp.]